MAEPDPPESVGWDDEPIVPEVEDPWKVLGEDGYVVDEDAPKTPEGKINRMSGELRRLSWATLKATLLVGVLLAITDAWNGTGFANTAGFFVGGLLATANLWMLAGGFFAVVDQRAVAPRVLLATLGSMAVMFGVGLYVVVARREWTLGFALGIAIPAAGGVLYAFEKRPGRDG